MVRLFNRNTIGVALFALLLLQNVLCGEEPAAKESAKGKVKPIPEKLVVLTFDDACASHFSFVAPLLKKYGFGATFYVCETTKNFSNKKWYMSWEQISELNKMGFEVGNHTLTHAVLGKKTVEEGIKEFKANEERCAKYKIPRPTTFCWPVYSVNKGLYPYMADNGYVFARGGGERTYDPAKDDAFNVPSFTVPKNLFRNKNRFAQTVKKAVPGQAVVLTFHGVPDMEHHRWVNTTPAEFEKAMKYLKDNEYKVIAMRDLAKYVAVKKAIKKENKAQSNPLHAAGDGKHLFILSGQSNMAGLNPSISFTPTVEAAFGKDNVIVVKQAKSGAPIRCWYKKWKAPEGKTVKDNHKVGQVYDWLMNRHVRRVMKNQEFESIVFVWMQGERDAKTGMADVYEASLKGLIQQLRDDLGRQDVHVVIGRISDCGNGKFDGEWDKVREAQVKVADDDPLAAWIDTDDLNNKKNSRTGQTTDDLHYTKEGFKILGERFAEKAIELIKK